jgi:hypothetical protein
MNSTRRTVRTVFQLTLSLAAVLPLLVSASGLDQTLPPLALALGVAAAVTRVMALPAVEQLLQRFAPWLAASEGN